MIALSLLLCLALVPFSSAEGDEPKRVKPPFVVPTIPPNAFTVLYFGSPNDLNDKLILSKAKKEGIDESIAKYDGIWSVEVPPTSAIEGDYALVLKSKAKHHAVSHKLLRPIDFTRLDELVIQYEVKFEDGMDCGGAYIKLLSDSPGLDLHNFNDKTPYTIMFGPDKCGGDHKFHFIIRHKNPKTGKFEEKHAKKVSESIDSYFSDKRTHLYTLVMRSDNTFERYIDQSKVQSGSLLTDMEPPINPPKEIDDPNDKKPADWDERETIVDVNAKKPDDWDEDAPEFIIDESATKPEGWLDDEPEQIPDPTAKKPEDWDSEMDGDWEAPKVKNPKCESAPGCGEWHKPQIANPKYKGKWRAPLIPNPAYKGTWKPAKIQNPEFFEDKEPFKGLSKVAAVGLELWSMTENVVFDNFFISDSLREANAFAKETWAVKTKEERLADPKARSVVDAVKETYKDKPWLVFVIGLVCTLPLLLCCVYFCRSPRPSTKAVHKKTDEPTPDDLPSKYEAVKTVESHSGGEADADEEGESTEEDVQVPKDAGGDSDPVKLAGKKADLESDSNDEAAPEEEPSKPEKTNVRKRRSRKE
ncbi:unnamed protein product [Calicophoron daubneyi]|uniref:Calnexin n=1 Tax=Calicophoron daubneyi TaxID=300641 RepID=A0AAV2T6Y4_CALDB